MNKPASPPPAGAPLAEFQRPKIDPDVVRAAVLLPNGEQILAEGQRRQFESLNAGVHQSQSTIELAEKRRAILERKVRRQLKKLEHTEPTRVVIVREKQDRLPWSQVASAAGLVVAAAGALWMGNRVGANYIVNSGSDLYAADPSGASLFMGVAILAGALLKVFEHRLRDDTAKALYSHLLFAVGLGAFLVWAAMMALMFAPETAGSVAWLVGGGAAGPSRTSLLLFSHLIADVACSYAVFAGAEQLALAGRKRELRRNPLYDDLALQTEESWKAIEKCSTTCGLAEDFLRRFEAGADQAELEAKLAFQLEAARQEQVRDAAVAAAKGKSLNT